MRLCGNISCVPLTDIDGWSPNQDIIGYGVPAAFISTALLTFAAMVLGYCTDSLPDDYLNDGDRDAIKRIRQSWIYRSALVISSLWRSFCKLLDWCVGRAASTPSNVSLTRSQKQEALQAFVLSLSDQQLVTGIAILVGAYLNPCTISGAEFEVVTSLAWFSSFTHLATLDILRDYLRDNEVVRNWRIAGMLITLGLLIPAFLTSLLGAWADTSLGCSWNRGLHGNDNAASVSLFTAWALVMLHLLTGYTTRIANLFAEPGSGDRTLADILTSLYLRFTDIDPAKRRDILHTAKVSRQHEKLGPCTYAGHSHSRRRHYLRRCLYHYDQSFLARIGALVFYLSFGITRVVVFTQIVMETFPLESSKMDFGQIVPLVLLLLPLLTAAEVIYKKQSPGSSSPVMASTPGPLDPNILTLFVIHVLAAGFVGFTLTDVGSHNYIVTTVLILTGVSVLFLFQLAWTVGLIIELHSMWEHVVEARKSKRLAGSTIPLLAPVATNSAVPPANAPTTTNVAASTSPPVPSTVP